MYIIKSDRQIGHPPPDGGSIISETRHSPGLPRCWKLGVSQMDLISVFLAADFGHDRLMVSHQTSSGTPYACGRGQVEPRRPRRGRTRWLARRGGPQQTHPTSFNGVPASRGDSREFWTYDLPSATKLVSPGHPGPGSPTRYGADLMRLRLWPRTLASVSLRHQTKLTITGPACGNDRCETGIVSYCERTVIIVSRAWPSGPRDHHRMKKTIVRGGRRNRNGNS